MFTIIFSVLVANSTLPTTIPQRDPTAIVIEKPKEGYQSKSVLMKIAQVKGVQYKVPPLLLVEVISCENTTWDTYRQSDNIYTYNDPKFGVKKGNRENSWGLAQINLDYNKKITKKQATDPAFSIDYMAKKISLGSGKMWKTCYPKALEKIKSL